MDEEAIYETYVERHQDEKIENVRETIKGGKKKTGGSGRKRREKKKKGPEERRREGGRENGDVSKMRSEGERTRRERGRERTLTGKDI